MKNKKLLYLLLSLLLILTGCQKTQDAPTGDSGEMTEVSSDIVIGQTWVVKNTVPTDSSVPWALTSHGVSETVFMLNQEGQLYSRYIDTFEKTGDLTWKATTKNEAKFSNGDVVDANAIADAMNAIQANNPLSNSTAGVVTFVATDDKTLEITTERELQRLDSLLTEWSNIVFKDLGDGNFVYSGPYMIESLQEGIELNLIPNMEYPDADQRPNIKIIAFKDTSAMKLAFEAGEIDMAFTVTPEISQMLKDSGKIVKTIEAGYQYFGILNLNSKVLKDQKVREAINLGINREEYVQALKGGRVATGFFAQYYDFAGDVQLKNDMEAAKALLDEAGYPMDGDVRVKDGEALSIKLVTYPSRPDLSVIMQIMASQLKELGFEVSTEVVDGIDNVAKEGGFDLILYAQHTAPTGNPAFALNQFFRTDGPKNFASYSSSVTDDLLDRLGNEDDESARVDISKEIQQVISQDLPVLYLVDPQWHIALSERLSDYQPYNGDYYIVNSQLR